MPRPGRTVQKSQAARDKCARTGLTRLVCSCWTLPPSLIHVRRGSRLQGRQLQGDLFGRQSNSIADTLSSGKSVIRVLCPVANCMSGPSACSPAARHAVATADGGVLPCPERTAGKRQIGSGSRKNQCVRVPFTYGRVAHVGAPSLPGRRLPRPRPVCFAPSVTAGQLAVLVPQGPAADRIPHPPRSGAGAARAHPPRICHSAQSMDRLKNKMPGSYRIAAIGIHISTEDDLIIKTNVNFCKSRERNEGGSITENTRRP